MPSQPGLAALRELIRSYVDLTLDCDVVLILKRANVPASILDRSSPMAPRLGYHVWLNSLPTTRDTDDVCFALLGAACQRGD